MFKTIKKIGRKIKNGVKHICKGVGIFASWIIGCATGAFSIWGFMLLITFLKGLGGVLATLGLIGSIMFVMPIVLILGVFGVLWFLVGIPYTYEFFYK